MRTILNRLASVCISLFVTTALLAAETERELRFDDFYSGGGPQGPVFSVNAKSMAGKRVRVTGYVAPPFRAEAEFMILTRSPMHVCPYCTPDNNWPIDIIVVIPRGPVPATNSAATLAVTGTLELGPKIDPVTGMTSQLRLMDAVIDTTLR
jgi:hypothetical protein